MTKYIPSSINIILRTAKTPSNPHGAENVKFVAMDKPAVFIIGGSGTEEGKHANHYAARMESLLRANNLQDKVNIYSVFFKFNSRTPFLDRVNLFRKSGRNPHITPDEAAQFDIMMANEPEPKFIEKLFRILIRPRIADKKKNRLDFNTAVDNISKLRIFLHCYGSSVILYLQKMMRAKMLEIGYSTSETALIQKNLLVIAHTPSAPIDKSDFTFLAFGSAEDETVEHYNIFNAYARIHSSELKPSFFPKPYGNLFAVGDSKISGENEHHTTGLAPCENAVLTKDGGILFAAERNVIVNSLKSSLDGGPLPSVEELVSGPDIDFKQMLENGTRFIKAMVRDGRIARRNIKAKQIQQETYPTKSNTR
ncbi:MAG: hypothetical protein LBD50_02270 [Rickettsiales bacterium]|jgi:hypothetical protein|nr:hypothetical protein [Rickettsiales bacterium]